MKINKRFTKIKYRNLSTVQKTLVIFLEIAFLFDFSIYPLPAKAAEISNDSLKENIVLSDGDVTQSEEINIQIIQAQIDANKAQLSSETEPAIIGDDIGLEVIGEEPVDESASETTDVQTKTTIIEPNIKKEQPKKITTKSIKKSENGAQLEHNNKKYKIVWSDYRTITGYNSDPRQTDDTPCLTANNFNVCQHGVEDTVAANFLKFGTKIRIPEAFGNRIFVVRDRMNRRYPGSVDVWMLDHSDALSFGRKSLKIEILEEI